MGPLLFNVAFDALLEKCDLPSCGLGVEFTSERGKDDLRLPGDDRARNFKVSTLAYGDDLILISKNLSSLTEALGKIKQVGEPLGIRINVVLSTVVKPGL